MLALLAFFIQTCLTLARWSLSKAARPSAWCGASQAIALLARSLTPNINAAGKTEDASGR
jgi:hypothetical protein